MVIVLFFRVKMAFNLKGGLYGEKKETQRLQADATSLADLKVCFLADLYRGFVLT
jgi:hypothetical protein